MKREIKFRAWDGEEMRDNFSVTAYGELIMGGEPYPTWKIMQFTGLLDKNGKEIYESDIVKSEYGKGFVGEVCYECQAAAYWIKWIEKTGTHDFVRTINRIQDLAHGEMFGSDTIQLNQVEIIGNIYENPELLNH